MAAGLLKVYAPSSLVDLFKETEGEIQNTMANFGHIPYGQSMIGRLYFNASNPDGCQAGSNFTNDFSGDPDEVLSPIFLVEASGKCSFVTQTRNIAKAGGALALIIDQDNEDVSNVVLSDDGTGAGIRIPAMLINKIHGDILKKHLTTAGEKELKETLLKADFLVTMGINNNVDAELWYTSSDDKSLDFIRNMAEYYEPILG